MRMWNVATETLCNKHLFGEHVETHMFIGTMNARKSIDGYVKNELIVVDELKERHDQLASEIVKRGYKHSSPLVVDEHIMKIYKGLGMVNIAKNYLELANRCEDCKKLQNKYCEIVNIPL